MSKTVSEICGDIPLSWANRCRYFSYGLRQIVGSIGQRYSVEIAHANFGNDDVQSKIIEGASPLRAYTSSLAARVVREYLGEAGFICDIGCGLGGHSRLFEGREGRSRYVGVDTIHHPGWSTTMASGATMPRHFVRMTAEDLGLASDSLGFTFSSSALEHVPNIQRTIGELTRAMRPGAYGLHIVPGVWSLILYLFHGYRRFSAGGLVDLFQRAGLQVERVWSLGGIPSFLLHALWITGVEMILVQRVLGLKIQLRKGRARPFYSWLLTWALRMDPFLPFAPAGYAVLIRKL